MNLKKTLLVKRAEKYEGRPFWSQPVDARIKGECIEVKMKLAFTISDDPQWVSVCAVAHPDGVLTDVEVEAITAELQKAA